MDKYSDVGVRCPVCNCIIKDLDKGCENCNKLEKTAEEVIRLTDCDKLWEKDSLKKGE